MSIVLRILTLASQDTTTETEIFRISLRTIHSLNKFRKASPKWQALFERITFNGEKSHSHIKF